MIVRKSKYKLLLCFAIFVSLTLACCSRYSFDVNRIASINFNGSVEKIETIGYYSSADAVVFLNLAGLPGKIETTCGFYLYRVTYRTKNYDNTNIWVSGLLAIPDSKEIKGIVCYQHGTNPERANAPSKPSTDEGIGISSVFAGNNYILLIPDYIGLGVSNEIPTYLHSASTIQCVLDFISVGEKILTEYTNGQNSNLYLVGFSQGACATSGIHRELEMNNQTGLTLKASACVAGAYNLKDISLKYALENKSLLYLGYVANSYSHIYNQDLGTIINPEFVNLIPTLYDGSKSVDYILDALPDNPTQLYTPQIIEDINNANNNWFTSALEENETYMWTPITKIKLFYGSQDIDVSPEDAISAYNFMKNAGGNVDLINVGEYDHVESLLHALPEIQKWFNETE